MAADVNPALAHQLLALRAQAVCLLEQIDATLVITAGGEIGPDNGTAAAEQRATKKLRTFGRKIDDATQTAGE